MDLLKIGTFVAATGGFIAAVAAFLPGSNHWHGELLAIAGTLANIAAGLGRLAGQKALTAHADGAEAAMTNAGISLPPGGLPGSSTPAGEVPVQGGA